MNSKEITQSLVTGNWTTAELEEIALALKYARNQLCKSTNRSLSKGDTVKFTSPRTGVTFTGTVERIKPKYVLVVTSQGRYNVPGSLLETV